MSAVYLGHIVGCISTGSILNQRLLQHRIKWVLSFTMLLNSLSVFVFAHFHSFRLMLVARLFSGAMSAILVVYAPLWVDDYAPPSSATTWMAILQAAVPVGVVLGYVTSGIVQEYTLFGWQYTFYLQCLCLIPLALAIVFMPARHINLQHVIVIVQADSDNLNDTARSKNSSINGKTVNPRTLDAMTQEDVPSTWYQVQFILGSGLYLVTVSSLASLYFVVTGLQLWATAYLTAPEPVHASLGEVLLVFSITCITAPTFGVILGGILMDKTGGYSGNMRGATIIASICGTIAMVCAMAALTMHELYAFIALVWAVLAAGGAVVPITTGLNIVSVPKEYRPVSCSVAAIAYNLFGYFLGPLACGIASDHGGLRLGMFIVLGWSAVSWVCILTAAVIVLRTETVPQSFTSPGSAIEDNTPNFPKHRPSHGGYTNIETASLHSERENASLSLARALNEPISPYEIQTVMTTSIAASLYASKNEDLLFDDDHEATSATESEAYVRRLSKHHTIRVLSLTPGEIQNNRSFQHAGSSKQRSPSPNMAASFAVQRTRSSSTVRGTRLRAGSVSRSIFSRREPGSQK